MTKEELLEELLLINKKLESVPFYDTEKAHQDADKLLISFINDIAIERAYDKIDKWYA